MRQSHTAVHEPVHDAVDHAASHRSSNSEHERDHRADCRCRQPYQYAVREPFDTPPEHVAPHEIRTERMCQRWRQEFILVVHAVKTRIHHQSRDQHCQQIRRRQRYIYDHFFSCIEFRLPESRLRRNHLHTVSHLILHITHDSPPPSASGRLSRKAHLR